MIKADEKTGVVYSQWSVPSPKAAFLLIHGLGGHSRRWEFLAEFFLMHDFASYAIELKGFGRTEGLKGHIDSFNVYFNDIRRLRGIISKENPGCKIFLAGESMGGLISFLAASGKPGLFDGLVCLSPAFGNRMDFSILDYIKFFVPIFYNPKKQHKMPFSSKMCTRDPAYQKIMDSDKREHRLATSKLLIETLIAEIKSTVWKGKFNIPVLFLLAAEDALVDPVLSRKVFNRLEAKDKTIIEYPGMYHALSIELGREKVFEELLEWLQKRI